LQSGVKKLLPWLGIEPTTLDLSAQSGPFLVSLQHTFVRLLSLFDRFMIETLQSSIAIFTNGYTFFDDIKHESFT